MRCDLVAFYLVWAQLKGWKVPECHIRALHFLQNRGDHAVFMAFRGFSKSTLLAVYNAWRFWDNPQYRILHQGDSDGTAFKTSRDTKAVLLRHPFTAKWFKAGERGDVKFWWVPGAQDERNPSIQAAGILSNITSSRADEVQNDDTEVPRNISSPEMREKLRYRMGEQIHILVPGGKKIFIGTPHAHDSIYDEQIALGAEFLKIPMFGKEMRVEAGDTVRHYIGWRPEFVFMGIGEGTRVLKDQVHYTYENGWVTFESAPTAFIDLYAESAWPDRFTPYEMDKRRKECRTINEWDSQYQLHSKPVGDCRLNPDKLIPYDETLRIVHFNRTPCLMLGDARIVSSRAYWDCATGKVGSDSSVVSVILDDDVGNHYWHKCEAVTGEYAEFDELNGKITGGQVLQVVNIIKTCYLPELVVETNGVGTFVDRILLRALKEAGVRCGVRGESVSGNKSVRILSGIEPVLSSGVLWASVEVMRGKMPKEMREWNPDGKNQADDHIDSGAGALLNAPVRIGATQFAQSGEFKDWRPSGRIYEAETSF